MATSGSARWASLAALTVAYVLAGKLGLLFASVHASATAVWPPTGIALAALLILGVRCGRAVAAGAFLVNVTTAGSVATSLGIGLGNTLVEDNDDARDMLRHLLERTGHEVHEAADGLTGLDRGLWLELDAAVIDIGLPEMDGYEVARRLRAAGRGGVLLVAITGYGQAGDRQRSSEAGFDAHLTKPVDPLALESLLVNLPLDPRRTGR